jgi:hypothetical protein
MSDRSKQYAERWSAKRKASMNQTHSTAHTNDAYKTAQPTKTPTRKQGEFTPDPLSSNRFKINEGVCKKMLKPQKLFSDSNKENQDLANLTTLVIEKILENGDRR